MARNKFKESVTSPMALFVMLVIVVLGIAFLIFRTYSGTHSLTQADALGGLNTGMPSAGMGTSVAGMPTSGMTGAGDTNQGGSGVAGIQTLTSLVVRADITFQTSGLVTSDLKDSKGNSLIDCGRGVAGSHTNCSTSLTKGKSITLTAWSGKDGKGKFIGKWAGDKCPPARVSPTAASYTFNMTDSFDCSITF